MRIALAPVLVLALGVASPACAQSAFPRQSAWLSLTLEPGWARHTCDQCNPGGPGARSGSALAFGMGGSPSTKFQVGGQFLLWSRPVAGDTSEGMGDISAAVYYFPRYRRRFFVESGLGFGLYLYGVPHKNGDHVIADSGVVEGTSWSSWDLTLATGYDIPVGRHVALRSRVAYDYTNIGTVHNPDMSVYATGWKQNLWTAGVWLFVHKPAARG